MSNALLVPQENPSYGWNSSAHFADAETAVQRGEVICLSSLSWEVTEPGLKSVCLTSGSGSGCGFLCACKGGAGPECWPLKVSGLHTGLGQRRLSACPPAVSTAPCLAPYPQSPPSPGLPLHFQQYLTYRTQGCGKASVPLLWRLILCRDP